MFRTVGANEGSEWRWPRWIHEVALKEEDETYREQPGTELQSGGKRKSDLGSTVDTAVGQKYGISELIRDTEDIEKHPEAVGLFNSYESFR